MYWSENLARQWLDVNLNRCKLIHHNHLGNNRDFHSNLIHKSGNWKKGHIHHHNLKTKKKNIKWEIINLNHSTIIFKFIIVSSKGLRNRKDSSHYKNSKNLQKKNFLRKIQKFTKFVPMNFSCFNSTVKLLDKFVEKVKRPAKSFIICSVQFKILMILKLWGSFVKYVDGKYSFYLVNSFKALLSILWHNALYFLKRLFPKHHFKAFL